MIEWFNHEGHKGYTRYTKKGFHFRHCWVLPTRYFQYDTRALLLMNLRNRKLILCQIFIVCQKVNQKVVIEWFNHEGHKGYTKNGFNFRNCWVLPTRYFQYGTRALLLMNLRNRKLILWQIFIVCQKVNHKVVIE